MPAGGGWFVLNAREARWFKREGQGVAPGLQGRGDFRQLGMGVNVLAPGEPMAMYHWETDQEDFLVLSGEALLVIEGEERPLRQWDFVYCPPKTEHVLVGAGDGPSVILAMSSRENQQFGPYGEYPQNEVAAKYGASPRDSEDPDADWPESVPSRYREGWLP